MRRLNAQEKNKLYQLIDGIYFRLPHAVWCPRSVEWFWDKIGAGVLGKFQWTTPKRIFLSYALERAGVEYAASTAVHELRHKYQFEMDTFGYLLGLPFRRFTIEPSAVECEKAADKLLGLEGLRDAD